MLVSFEALDFGVTSTVRSLLTVKCRSSLVMRFPASIRFSIKISLLVCRRNLIRDFRWSVSRIFVDTIKVSKSFSLSFPRDRRWENLLEIERRTVVELLWEHDSLMLRDTHQNLWLWLFYPNRSRENERSKEMRTKEATDWKSSFASWSLLDWLSLSSCDYDRRWKD